MVKTMFRFFEYVYKLVNLIMLIMLIIMIGSISINVVARYFGMAFTWIDEVSRLTFVWMSCMAIVIGLKKGLHPAFAVIVGKTDGIVTKLLLTVINILILIFLIYLLKGGIDYIFKIHVQKTAILGISVAWKYSAVPFAAIIMILEVVKKLVFVWRKDIYRLID